jgi:Fe-S-cluster containining protein
MSKKLTILKKNWYEDGVRFKCTSCGKCCTGKGGVVFLSMEEAKNISNFLKITLEDLISTYCRKIEGKLILKDAENTDTCIFLKNKQCQIYQHRPTQCKAFPYWPSIMRSKKNWEKEKNSCEGIDHPEGEIIDLKKIQENLQKMKER